MATSDGRCCRHNHESDRPPKAVGSFLDQRSTTSPNCNVGPHRAGVGIMCKRIEVGDLVTLGLVVEIPETNWVRYACILTRDGRVIKRALDHLEIANEKNESLYLRL